MGLRLLSLLARSPWARRFARNVPLRWIIVWVAKMMAKRVIRQNAAEMLGTGLVDSKMGRRAAKRFFRSSEGKWVLDAGVGRPVTWALKNLLKW